MFKKVHLRIASVSVNGNVRIKNEDNFYINGERLTQELIKYPVQCEFYSSREHLIAVFDGMGGEKRGELASEIAANGFENFHKKLINRKVTNEIIKDTFDDFIEDLNTRICEERKRVKGRIGTTMATVLINDGVAHCFNLGDSRVYIYRRKKLLRITNDHNESALLLKLGMLTNENARSHPSKYKLTQHLGMTSDEIIIRAEYYTPILLRTGDIFILCSDGLIDEMSDIEICEYFEVNKDIKVITSEIIDEVLKRDAKDNITIITAEVLKITSFLGFKI